MPPIEKSTITIGKALAAFVVFGNLVVALAGSYFGTIMAINDVKKDVEIETINRINQDELIRKDIENLKAVATYHPNK
jgi:hypothetical protein